MATNNVVFPLKPQAVSTATTTALTTGTIRSYNASAGALTPALPALSTVVDDDYLIVEKDLADTTTNTVTVTCAGTDTFASGVTTIVLAVRGERVELQAATIGASRVWKVKHQTLPRTGLDSRYATFVDLSGNPIAASRVQIVIDTTVTPNQVSDIVIVTP